MPAAYASAKRSGRILFVDAWAPWCHTCLSLQHYVFTDPSLVPYAERVLFASIDTDRASSAKFLEHHNVNVWPMLFVIDPSNDRLLASWPGSLSARQLRRLLDDALAIHDASAPPGDPRRDLAEARTASAEKRWADALASFDKVLARTNDTWPQRSEAMVGKMWVLYRRGDYSTCATWGRARVAKVHGAASPADFSWLLLTCAGKLPAGSERDATERAAVEKLSAFTKHPPAHATVDDKADALGILADALKQRGDPDEFRRLYQQRIAMLERAATEAPSPAIASTFDYPRAMSYLALGEGDKAVAMLRARVEQLPDSYEPPGRLGEVLVKMGHASEAIRWLDRALGLAYGPRKLRYLKLKAEALDKLGRQNEQIRVLEQELSVGQALPPSQLRPGRLESIRERLKLAKERLLGHGNRP